MESDHLNPKHEVRIASYAMQRERDRGISNRSTDIGLSLVTLTIPMLVFSGVLLGLIFTHRVVHIPSQFNELQFGDSRVDDGAYYVDLNSTFLIFVASWSSSLAPALVGFALTLTSYPIAQRMRQNIERQNNESLPTPHQLALLLQFLNSGGFGSLWSWIKYRFAAKGRRQFQALSLTLVANVAIGTTLLGLLVFLADTWLHVATKTVELVQVTPLTGATDYSFELAPSCASGTNTAPNAPVRQCALSIAGTAIFLMNNTQSMQVLNNVSESIRVLTYQDQYTYLGVPPSDEVAKRDYTAKTYGMQTQCKLVSKQCNLQAPYGASTPFHCTDAWSGDLTAAVTRGLDPRFSMTYFTNDTISSNVTIVAGVNNPFYFGIAATSLDLSFMSGINDTFKAEFVQMVHGGFAFLLQCSSTLYDVEYDNVNGTVTRFVATPSNASVANLWQAPAAYTEPSLQQIRQSVGLASLSRTSQELVDKMSLSCSQAVLAVGSQVVRPRAAVQAQERTNLIVARIPMAPLYTLIVSNLSFVVVGIILAITAWTNADGPTREIQARLSIVGLAANYFEGSRARTKVDKIEKLFQETEGNDYHRAAIGRASQGGYSYKLVSTAATASSTYPMQDINI